MRDGGREGGMEGESEGQKEGQREGETEGGRERGRKGVKTREEGITVLVIVLIIIVRRRSCNVTLYGWPTDSTLKTTTLSMLTRPDLLSP